MREYVINDGISRERERKKEKNKRRSFVSPDFEKVALRKFFLFIFFIVVFSPSSAFPSFLFPFSFFHIGNFGNLKIARKRIHIHTFINRILFIIFFFVSPFVLIVVH